MRLKTKRITVNIPVSEDGTSILVQELKRNELIAIAQPCKEFFSFKDDNEAESRFMNFLSDIEQTGNFNKMIGLIQVFHNIFKKMVIGWEGLEDEQGSLLEFNTENIDKIIEFDEDGFVFKFVPSALAAIQARKEEVSKNCLAGSIGSSTLSDPAVKDAKGSSSGIVENVTVRDNLTLKMN